MEDATYRWLKTRTALHYTKVNRLTAYQAGITTNPNQVRWFLETAVKLWPQKSIIEKKVGIWPELLKL